MLFENTIMLASVFNMSLTEMSFSVQFDVIHTTMVRSSPSLNRRRQKLSSLLDEPPHPNYNFPPPYL